MDVWSHDRADHLERSKRLDGMKDKKKAIGGVRKVMGNLRFPLDKTYHGCPYYSGKLYDVGRTARTQTDTALPEHDCTYRRKYEKQDVRLIDGSWCLVQQKAALR